MPKKLKKVDITPMEVMIIYQNLTKQVHGMMPGNKLSQSMLVNSTTKMLKPLRMKVGEKMRVSGLKSQPSMYNNTQPNIDQTSTDQIKCIRGIQTSKCIETRRVNKCTKRQLILSHIWFNTEIRLYQQLMLHHQMHHKLIKLGLQVLDQQSKELQHHLQKLVKTKEPRRLLQTHQALVQQSKESQHHLQKLKKRQKLKKQPLNHQSLK
jgi:hypothetical protein